MKSVICIAGLLSALAAGTAAAQTPSPDTSLIGAVVSGKPILEARLRYEGVDQANFTRSAEALTLRSRIGWETKAWSGLSGLIEIENVSHADGRFNDTVNRKTLYPGVNDPDVTELNRLQLAWAPSRDVQMVVGRQRLTLDDQRFISYSNWRQDEQTFDAAWLDARHGAFSATYVYIAKANRTLAQSADYTSASHVLNAYYTASPALKLEGFVYALDLKQAPAASTQTLGLKATGQFKAGVFKLAYAAAWANQTDYASNPAHYRVPYAMGELAASWSLYTAKLNYESLGSDGRRGFATPLASLHGFQGWADAFTTTPARGVDDLNLSLTANPPVKLPYLSQVQLMARHHDFTYAQGSGSLGTEWNFGAQGAVTPHLTALIDYADYHGVAAVPGRRKLWLQLEYRY